MASRVKRIVIEMSMISIKVIRPNLWYLWSKAKKTLSTTPLGKVVNSPVLCTTEEKLSDLTTMLLSKMATIHRNSLKDECKYLELELIKCKNKIGCDVEKKRTLNQDLRSDTECKPPKCN